MLVARGNDGNYLQHSMEVGLAHHLSKKGSGCLHIALCHGMAPFEPCAPPKPRQQNGYLDEALEAVQQVAAPGDPPLVTAYRRTNASRENYPNSAELLAATVGREQLKGGIAETNPEKHEALAERWEDQGLDVSFGSWREALAVGGVLACPEGLNAPWLFTMDPMSFSLGQFQDDDRIYAEDLEPIADALKAYVATDKPGAAAIFVYGMMPEPRQHFWQFAEALGAPIGLAPHRYWMHHQGGNRNLVAVYLNKVVLPVEWLPAGVLVEED